MTNQLDIKKKCNQKCIDMARKKRLTVVKEKIGEMEKAEEASRSTLGTSKLLEEAFRSTLGGGETDISYLNQKKKMNSLANSHPATRTYFLEKNCLISILGTFFPGGLFD